MLRLVAMLAALFVPVVVSGQWVLEAEYSVSNLDDSEISRSSARYVVVGGDNISVLHDRELQTETVIGLTASSISVNANGDILFPNSLKIWDNTEKSLKDISGPCSSFFFQGGQLISDDRSFGTVIEEGGGFAFCGGRLPDAFVTSQVFPEHPSLSPRISVDSIGRFALYDGFNNEIFTVTVDGVVEELGSGGPPIISTGGRVVAKREGENLCYWPNGTGAPQSCLGSSSGWEDIFNVNNNGESFAPCPQDLNCSGNPLMAVIQHETNTLIPLLPDQPVYARLRENYANDFGLYFVQGVNAPDDTLSFVSVEEPDKIYNVIGPINGRIFTLDVSDNGDLVVPLRMDGESDYLIQILDAVFDNEPPILDPIGSKGTYEFEELSFSVTANDPEGGPVTITAEGLPPGATFDGGTFFWTPQRGDRGSYLVRFTATDDIGLSAASIISINVEAYVPSYNLALNLTDILDEKTALLITKPLLSSLQANLLQVRKKLENEDGINALIWGGKYLGLLDTALSDGVIDNEGYAVLEGAMNDVIAVAAAVAFPDSCTP